jgi:membrane-bound lytic murein transglycosylase D
MTGLTKQTGLITLLFMGACASREPARVVAQDELELEAQDLVEEEAGPEVNIPQRKELVLRSKIPLEVNQEVMNWIRFFAQKERERFESYLVRGSQHKTLIQEILKKNDLPEELYYLALIESGFVHHARSHANAVGYWQFVRPTGLQYGLRISPYVDERQDLVRATQAAAKYLKSLFNQFDDWHLALAAYNAGPGRIRGAIRRSGHKTYWALARSGYIPSETRNYVPQFMAALIIGSFPERFNFEIPEAESIPDIRPVHVPSPIQLTDLAKISNVPVAVIKKLNPHLTAGYTPPNTSRYYVWMPATLKLTNEVLIERLKPFKKDSRLFAGAAALRTHVVRRGETLNLIARRYRKSLSQLKRENNLRGNQLSIGQQLRIPGTRSEARGNSYYKVRNGDSLASVAQKHGLSISALKQLNGIRGSKIYRGQSLKVARN